MIKINYRGIALTISSSQCAMPVGYLKRFLQQNLNSYLGGCFYSDVAACEELVNNARFKQVNAFLRDFGDAPISS